MRRTLNRVWRPGRVSLAYFFILLFAAIALKASTPTSEKLSPEEIDRRVDALISKLTLGQKLELIGASQDGLFFHAMPTIGLPSLKMSDGPMGVRTWGPSTAYAAGMGLAASWDVDLARKVGVSLGRDARARGVHILLGPGVNIYRAPMDGRNFEFFGEDPCLAGQIAANYILGVQSQGVVAMVKHLAANNAEYDRSHENAIVDERTLREIYLPAFEAAVKEGHVGAVMDSYNLVNGEHSTQNKFLNIEVLRKDWGFEGILMSDEDATHDGIAATNAGLDVEDPAKYMTAKTLLPAIRSGEISVATINEKVRDILRVAMEFGFIDHDQTDLNIPLYSRRSEDVALKSAEESMVLLKNEGDLLPLNMSQIHSIAVIGPNAYPAEATGGGSARVTAIAPVSFMTGLSNALAPSAKVYWNRGVKDLPEIFEASRFFTDKDGTRPGLTQEEFSNASFSGEAEQVSVVPNLNNDWSSSEVPGLARSTGVVRWQGYYIPKTSGLQTFVATERGRESYRLYLNGKLALKGEPGEGEPQAVTLDPPAGQPVAVRLDYLPSYNRIFASLAAVPAEDMLEPNVRKTAAMADVVILSVGFDPETEGEGHDRTYSLPPGQDELIKAALAANPRTIVVLTAGGSVDTSPWLNRAPALLQSWYGGSEAGRALAAVLTGRVNPSGKLPFTWWRRQDDNPTYKSYYPEPGIGRVQRAPAAANWVSYYEEPGRIDVKYGEGVFLGYRADGQPGQATPLFPFGYGLSYTRFTFSHLSISPRAASPNGSITITFDIRNIGQRAGAEIAEVYVGDPSASVPRPTRELKSFQRVNLEPGEIKHVSVTLNRRSLAYWSLKSESWKSRPGQVRRLCGGFLRALASPEGILHSVGSG